jgi:tetratricopeptide (TPR) repeat protein
MTMSKPRLFAVQSILVLMPLGGGCALTRPVSSDVRVPPELLRGSPYTAGGEPARSRYIVRMTDGQRDWEIQLPEIATAYEVKVPLGGKPATGLGVDMAGMTAADREILADREASERAAAADASGGETGEGTKRAGLRGKRSGSDDDDDAGDGDARPGKGKRRAAARAADAAGSAADKPPSARASYLLTLAKVKDLYRTRHYELALVELVELERQYPNDEHILSMKGSLHERLGNKALAREAWQQVLTLNPFNLAVLEALQRLGK